MEHVELPDNGGFNIGDYVLYNSAIYFIEGTAKKTRWPYNVLLGKQVLSSKFKLIKKAKTCELWEPRLRKMSKQDVIESFKKIYLDWDETMKNIDTAFERTV